MFLFKASSQKTLKIFYRCGEVMTEATLKELGEANWKARLAAMEEVLDLTNFSSVFTTSQIR